MFAEQMRRLRQRNGMTQQDVFLAADFPERYGYKLLAEEKPALKFNNNNDLLKFLRNCRKLRLQNV